MSEGMSLEGVVEEHGFLSWLGVELESQSEGRVVMRVPYDEDLLNPTLDEGKGSVHGGVAATLIDTACGFSLRGTFDDPGKANLTTTDLDVKYLRPATGDLVATAEVVRAGGSVGVSRATVESEYEGETVEVAVGSATYRLFR